MANQRLFFGNFSKTWGFLGISLRFLGDFLDDCAGCYSFCFDFSHKVGGTFYFRSSYSNQSSYIYIYDPGSRFATTPPPPPHGMVPKPAFCNIPHENVVFAVFFAWWVAGAVRNPANSLDFCNQPSENVLFAMFRLRHRGVVPPRPLLFLCQIII